MTNLRCNCPTHSDLIAKYNDDTVEIKCKHGKIVRLKVVDGKIKEERHD
jgi:hypothetical protein